MHTIYEIWGAVAPHVTPPLAAGAAIIPTFYGFELKSARQLGESRPRFSPLGGFRAAPTVGAIFGTQMAAQLAVEKAVMPGEKAGFSSILLSSFFVGGLSAPALAVFNGQTMKKTAKESLRALSIKQSLAIIARETSFLFSIRISNYVSDRMKEHFGENKAIVYASTFASGAIGSLFGHPADTALTIWQKGMKITTLRILMNGSLSRSITVGTFACCYKITSELLESTY
jgi:hypothetical protein